MTQPPRSVVSSKLAELYDGRDILKKYKTEISKLSRITGDAKRLKYLGWRNDLMCKQIVQRF